MVGYMELIKGKNMKKGYYGISVKNGFTLLELLVAMLLTVIVSTAIYMVYNSQHKSYTVQEQVSAMQQNLRAAMYFMQRDIRMAGCDPETGPSGERKAGAGIVTANVAELEFTMDITGGESDGIDNDRDGLVDENGEWFDGELGDTGEQVRYGINTSGELGRELSGSGGLQQIAEDIEVLNFVYLDENGTRLDDDGSGNVAASIGDIRQIIVTLIARSERADSEYTNNTVYRITLPDATTLTILPAQGDHFRRRMLSITITPRNLGL